MRLAILGGPGAGKGTQAQLLCDRLGIPWISTGEIFRQGIKNNTELGRKAAPYVEKGELVPDPIAIEFIRDRLLQSDAAKGWLLDGYPRTAFQAEELDFLLDDLGQQLDRAIWIDVDKKELKRRSMARARSDDNPDAIARRLEAFYQRTIPILDYYEPRNKLLKVDGDRPIEEVHRDVISGLDCDAS